MTMRITRRIALALAGAALLPASVHASTWPPMTVHKDPNCGCCGDWVVHLRAHGFQVTEVETQAINRVKAKLGIPSELASCHTGEIAGYLIEGHVPASAVGRLLKERPKAKGLAVPGMPLGSPGMGGEPEEFDVILFGGDAPKVYGRFKGDKEI